MSWPIIGTMVVLIILAIWLWWWWPKQHADRMRLSDPKTRADVEDNFRKTIGQLVGGAAVLIGAWFAYLQFTEQQQTSRRQFTQQQQAARDLLISNQVAKGFEQLGSGELFVRLGGIYALEGVMKTSEQHYQPVLEALSAFVREHTKTGTGDGPPATDVQAVLTVIGRREVVIGRGRPDLANTHMPKAQLLHADLSIADLHDADLRGAMLFIAELEHANLEHANLSGAGLSGADLNGANLTGADLSIADLTGADLSGANLTGAKITQAQLDRLAGHT